MLPTGTNYALSFSSLAAGFNQASLGDGIVEPSSPVSLPESLAIGFFDDRICKSSFASTAGKPTRETLAFWPSTVSTRTIHVPGRPLCSTSCYS